MVNYPRGSREYRSEGYIEPTTPAAQNSLLIPIPPRATHFTLMQQYAFNGIEVKLRDINNVVVQGYKTRGEPPHEAPRVVPIVQGAVTLDFLSVANDNPALQITWLNYVGED